MVPWGSARVVCSSQVYKTWFLSALREKYIQKYYKYSVQLLRSEHTSHAVVSSGYRGRHTHLPLLAKQGAFLLAHSL